MQKACPVCSSIYEADPKRLLHGRQTTCSRSCSYKYRQPSQAIEKTCTSCGRIYTRSPSHVKAKHGAEYCSRPCHFKGRTMGLTPREVTHPYEYTPESKAKQIASARTPQGKRVFHPLTCLNCKSLFEDPNWGRHRKSGMIFCSLLCCNNYRKGEKNPAWRGGHPSYYGPDWSRMRRETLQRDNHTCQRCKATPKGRRHDVHHIKPVVTFENPNDAHTIENLITLCRPCHMRVEWHGVDWDLPQL
jgi:hypothetical protein